jgi:insulysin
MKKIFLFVFFLPFLSFSQEKIPLLNPSLKERKIEKVLLENGIQAYLISDPETQKSGALIAVEAGSFNDPDAHLGLAHFLEHMLFMGTQTFPEPGEAMRFVQERGGMANAFTKENSTNYLFTVDHTSFPLALNRFSLFFQEPLFNPETLAKERLAVDQEFAKNKNSHYFRQQAVLQDVSKISHPFHRFTSGNKKSLEQATQKDLQAFFNAHYSAEKMHVVLLSPLSLTELKTLLNTYFSPIKKKNSSKPLKLTPPLPKSLEGSLITLESSDNTSTLTLLWQIPSNFEDNPQKLLAHVIGHEGKESLLAALKKEQLVSRLSAGTNSIGRSHALLAIEMDLTEKGVQSYESVLEKTFDMLNLLQNTAYPEETFQEVRELDVLNYQYRKREEPFNELMETALVLSETPFENFPEKTYVLNHFNKQAVEALAKQLTADKMVALLSLPKDKIPFTLDRKEPWLGISYNVSVLKNGLINHFANRKNPSAINYPLKNPYIPAHLTISSQKKATYTRPDVEKIIENEKILAFASKDNYFNGPESYLAFEIISPLLNQKTAKSTALAKIYLQNVKEELTEEIYLAHLAGLNVELSLSNRGLIVKTYGFKDKTDVLLEKVFAVLKNCPCDQKTFTFIKNNLMELTESFASNSSLEQAQELFNLAFKENAISYEELYTALKNSTFNEYKYFTKNLYDKNFIKALSLSPDETHLISEKIANLATLLEAKPLKPQEIKEPSTHILEEDSQFYVEKRKPKALGNSLILAIESPQYSFEKRASQQVLMELIKEPYFAALRTEQQTGYIVTSLPLEENKVLFNLFAVQSNTHSAKDLLYRSEAFIEKFLRNIDSEEISNRFNVVKTAQIALLEKPKDNLKTLGEELSLLAFEYNGDFNWMEKRVNALKKLDLQSFKNIAPTLLGKQSPRKIGFLVDGKVEPKVLSWEPFTPNKG